MPCGDLIKNSDKMVWRSGDIQIFDRKINISVFCSLAALSDAFKVFSLYK
jgi:hypothetical protein